MIPPKKTAPKAKKSSRISPIRQGFLVLGMHRSGTSSVAGTMVRIGVTAPLTLMAGKEDNARGHWESEKLAAFHDDLLSSAGSHWADWRAFNPDWFLSPVAHEFTTRGQSLLASEFGKASSFVLKDPRVCRFPRFWVNVFRAEGIEPKFVLPVRSPMEVAQSLRRRNGMSLRQGCLLWLRHVLDAERESRGHSRSIFRWNEFLQDWRACVARMQKDLAVHWPALSDTRAVDVDRFLSDDLKHQRFDDSALDGHPEIHRWVTKAYQSLIALADPEQDPTNHFTVLDEVRSGFEEACALFGSVMAGFEAEQGQLRVLVANERQSGAGLLADLEAERARAGELMSSMRGHLLSLTAEPLTDYETNDWNLVRNSLNEAVADHLAQREASRTELERQAAAAAMASRSWEQERNLLEETASALRAERDELTNCLLTFKQEAEAREADWNRLRTSLEQALANRIEQCDLLRSELEHARQSEETNRASMETVLADLRAESDRLVADLSARTQAALLARDRLAEERDDFERALIAARAEFEALKLTADQQNESHQSTVSELRLQIAVLSAELASIRQQAASPGHVLGVINEVPAPAASLLTQASRVPSSLPRLARNAVRLLRYEGFPGVARAISRRLHGQQAAPPTGTYQQWLADRLGRQDALALQHEADNLPFRPLISIIVPVYNTPDAFLRACIDSVIRQYYRHWQLVLVDDASPDERVRQTLVEYAAIDSRIDVKFRSSNGHISRTSNDALAAARGEWIALLDHDDILSADALLEIVRALNRDPGLDFLYSDKDMVSQDGEVFHTPLFKPEWSPEMLYSVNYLTHFNVIRTSLMREVGGFRPETDGAQDWDLFLRVSEKTSRIAHVPAVLYHWRVHDQSTSTGIDAKPYALKAQEVSLTDHLSRQKLEASAVPDPETGFRIKWQQSRTSSHVSCVIGATTAFNLATSISAVLSLAQRAGHRVVVVAEPDLRDEAERLWHAWHGTELASLVTLMTAGNDAPTTRSISHGCTSLSFICGDLLALSAECFEDLIGWVECHPQVGFCTGVVVASDDTVIEAGCVMDEKDGSASLFAGDRLHSWGIFGGALWYRNVASANPYLISFKLPPEAERSDVVLSGLDAVARVVKEMCRNAISGGLRGVVAPKVRGVLADDGVRFPQSSDPSLLSARFFHAALCPGMPPRLAS